MTLIGWQTSLIGFPFSVVANLTDGKLILLQSAFAPINQLSVNFGEKFAVKASVAELEEAISGYQAGEFALLNAIARKAIGTPFALKIWREISKVRPGETITYGQLASRAGNPAATRAAGTACGKNPLPVFVPCHRIVPSGGGIGNYAYGTDVKRKLLQHEFDKRHIQKSTQRK